jgi:hypothetical protein
MRFESERGAGGLFRDGVLDILKIVLQSWRSRISIAFLPYPEP